MSGILIVRFIFSYIFWGPLNMGPLFRKKRSQTSVHSVLSVNEFD